jgi:hypothetical protein
MPSFKYPAGKVKVFQPRNGYAYRPETTVEILEDGKRVQDADAVYHSPATFLRSKGIGSGYKFRYIEGKYQGRLIREAFELEKADSEALQQEYAIATDVNGSGAGISDTRANGSEATPATIFVTEEGGGMGNVIDKLGSAPGVGLSHVVAGLSHNGGEDEDMLDVQHADGAEECSEENCHELACFEDEDGLCLGHINEREERHECSTALAQAATPTPNAFICPLTQDVMTDPVIDREGSVFERGPIETWLHENQVSPLTRNPLTLEHLTPNRGLKELIEEHRASTTQSPDDLITLVFTVARNDEEGFKTIKGVITSGGDPVGNLKATLIDRNQHYPFHEACDNASRELDSIGRDYFNNNGTLPRLPCIRELGRAVTAGGFLYIDSLRLKDSHRGADKASTTIGSTALQLFLNEMVGRWSLAVYILDASGQVPEADCLQRFADEVPDRAEQIVRHQRLDARQFLRCGWQQVPEYNHMFATPAMAAKSCNGRTALSHEAVIAHLETAVKVTGARHLGSCSPPPQGLDLELLKLVMALAGTMPPPQSNQGFASADSYLDPPTVHQPAALASAADILNIEALVARGASVKRSHALNCCAARGLVCYLDVLIRVGEPDAINARDEHQLTPLMRAAGAQDNFLGRNIMPIMLDHLLRYGASKEATTTEGWSALGVFRAERQLYEDMTTCESIFLGEFGSQIEDLLMPSNGPTLADDDAQDNSGPPLPYQL